MADLVEVSTALDAQRAVKTWLNTCTKLPTGMTVSFEDLPENDVGICFVTEQAPAYTARYIAGGYKAEYRFRIIYRVLPTDDGDMLDAVETLAKIAEWCTTATPPDVTNAINETITRTSDVAVMNVYEDKTTDYSVSLTLTWEVF